MLYRSPTGAPLPEDRIAMNFGPTLEGTSPSTGTISGPTDVQSCPKAFDISRVFAPRTVPNRRLGPKVEPLTQRPRKCYLMTSAPAWRTLCCLEIK